MKISDRLTEKGVIIDSQSTDKQQFIAEMVAKAVESFELRHHHEILEEVLIRESHKSTGLGNGAAVPHAKSDYIDGIHVVVAINQAGIEFDSPDDKPVHIGVLVLSPSHDISPHIKTLSAIARVVSNPISCEKIMTSESVTELLEAFRESEDYD